MIRKAAARPKRNVAEFSTSCETEPAVRIIAPITAADENSIARNSSALPRKTAAKTRSSRSWSLSRSTPMNHRKAMPAKGIRLRARLTVPELAEIHSPASSGLPGTERFRSPIIAISRIQNAIPATAAAFGARKVARVSDFSCRMRLLRGEVRLPAYRTYPRGPLIGINARHGDCTSLPRESGKVLAPNVEEGGGGSLTIDLSQWLERTEAAKKG